MSEYNETVRSKRTTHHEQADNIMKSNTTNQGIRNHKR